jgi:PPP family 3-phenylpropionic acid transporter
MPREAGCRERPKGLRRYALFYFCYYAGLGAFSPYIGRFVDALGHSGYVLGLMMALWYGSRIVGPPAWNALTARSERPGQYLLLGSVFTLVVCAGFTTFHTALGLCVVMALFGLAVNPLLPQFEAMTLSALGQRSADYGRIRVWGSIGFLLVASSYGWLLDRFGAESFPWLVLPLYFAAVLAALPHWHARQPHDERPRAPVGDLLRRPGIPRFLLVAMLMQTSFGAFYVFYTLHLRAAGPGGLVVGLLWGAGVLSEIAMFWLMPRLFARHDAGALLGWCLAITALRWLLTALFPAQLLLMFAVQLLHAFSFAVFQACCMRQMAASFPGREGATGQSLLYSLSSGVGGVLGALLASRLWEWHGGYAAFLGAAVVVAIAWLVFALRPVPTAPTAG